MTTLLFSYGSNHPKQMAERLGHDVDTVGAFVNGYVRAFVGYSQRWGGGVATLVKKPGGVVYGLVAPVTKDDFAMMDKFEGIASGNYKRVKMKVTLANGEKADAIAYVATSKSPYGPTKAYLDAVAKTVGTHWSNGDGSKITWQDITIR